MKGHWIPPSPKEIIEKIKTKLGYSKTIPSGLGNDLVDAVSALKTRTETIAKTFVKTVGPLTPVNGVLDATFPDSNITAEMKATKLEVSDSSVFLDTVSVTCDVNNGAGYIRIQCSNMSGTCASATITIETVTDSSGITSADFDVLNRRIGDLSTLTTTAKTSAVDAINELDDQKTNQTNIAPVVTGTTATQNYKVNDLIIIGGILYKVTTPILSGETFISGTNIIQTNIDSVLSVLGSETIGFSITSSLDTLLSGGFYKVGKIVIVNFTMKSGRTSSGSPGVANVTLGELRPKVDSALSAIDITSGITTTIDASIPCGIGIGGRTFLKTITTDHIYAVTGVYVIN